MNFQQLCRYLHLPEDKVKKLVNQGAIPSRRRGGELRFAREEIHSWLETRIGDADAQGLAHVEIALEHSVPDGEIETPVLIADLIPSGAIAIPLAAKTRDSVLRCMVQIGVTAGLLWDAEAMHEAIKIREELHSTALDNGVALLHPRRPMPTILGDSFIGFGRTLGGIPFGGGFNNLTDIFFIICSMDDRIHLRILARLSRILTIPDFISKLREAQDESEVRDLIIVAESTFGITD
ncbi:MAG: PTS sugar transporter subunit IIA [Thermoguttaceae bacterium]